MKQRLSKSFMPWAVLGLELIEISAPLTAKFSQKQMGTAAKQLALHVSRTCMTSGAFHAGQYE